MNLWRPIIAAAACLLTLALLPGCKTAEKGDATKDEKKPADGKPGDPAAAPADAGAIDVSFLLSMNFNEAKTLSAATIEMPAFHKIAADSIEVTRTNEDGTPRRIRAKGRVFIEMGYREPAKALCQELVVSSDEVILRGKPVLQRGGTTMVEMDDVTVFYMYGTRLRAIGPHRVVNANQLMIGPDGLPLPTLGAWSNAPNPLLPPLSESSVPQNVRDEMMGAAEAELLHQQTRAQFGPATPPRTGEPQTPPSLPLKDGEKKEGAPGKDGTPPTSSTKPKTSFLERLTGGPLPKKKSP